MSDTLGTTSRARLFASNGNPIPEGAKVGYQDTSDGISLRYARWEATEKPTKGTVILLHGRAESIEKYYETIGELTRRGFGVLSFDWRGQGGSSRMISDHRKGYVEHFNHYLIDLETILTEVALPDCRGPYYIFAHSTGGLVALLAGPALTNRIQRMVLSSPLIRFGTLPMKQETLHKILGAMFFTGLGQIQLSSGASDPSKRAFSGNRITSDSRRFYRNKNIVQNHPKLGIGAPTAAWLFAASRAMLQISTQEHIASLNVPTLLVAAGGDRVVSSPAIEKYGARMRSGNFLTVDGSRHEIFQERDEFREQLLAAFDAFVPGADS